LAREQVLPVRRELVRQTAEGYRHLLATVSNPGEFGTVANFEQHMFPDLLDKPGRELAELLGEELPADAQLPRSYQGPTRLIVPTVRTSFLRGESLSIKVCVLAEKPSRELTLYWRRIGRGRFTHLPLRHVARGVYRAEFPSAATRGEDVEYYVECIADDGKRIIFPATAPKVGQTLVATD
jgi:hypothetical protein